MDVSLYHDTFDTFCEQLEKGANVLELACGPGNITQYLLKQRPELNILATDLSPRMLERARNNNPGATFRMLDSRDIAQLEPIYDAIMCGFCLPYLSKEQSVQLIRDARTILKENGVLYLSTMEDDYSKSGLVRSHTSGDELFMYFHEADYLVKALVENAFKVLDLQRKNYENADGTKTVDLIIIAGKRTG
jgi:2-polyprenyl-3-methyl-5-hydroxy-6-metoxy-1,4-benzoquinol methylase